MKLVAFMTSDAGQRILADLNYEYPIRKGVGGAATEKVAGPINPDTLALADIAKNRKAASEMVDQVGFDN